MARLLNNLGFLAAFQVALVLLLVSCGAQRAAGPVMLHPVPPAGNPYSLNQGALTFTGPGFTVTARPLDWRIVVRRYRDAGLILPYGDLDESLSRYIFFAVHLENNSTQSLFFNTLRASAFPRPMTLLVPVEASDIYMGASGAPEADKRVRSFRQTSFDGSVTIAPGRSMERYLVFPSPDGNDKTLRLVLNDLYLGSVSFDPTFVFEIFPQTPAAQ